MGIRSGNPLWKNGSTGGTPISAEALNRIEDALDSEDVYISELLEDSDSAINMSLKATIVSKIESYLDANPIAISGLDASDVGFDIVIAYGQSNNAAHATPVLTSIYDVTDPRIWQYACSGDYAGTIIQGLDPLATRAEDAGAGVGPSMQFAREWIRRAPVNRSALIVPLAVSAKNITPGSGVGYGSDLYVEAVAIANAAVESAGANARIVAITFIQGETDAANSKSAEDYFSHALMVLDGLRADITGATSAPIVVGSMAPEWWSAPHGTRRIARRTVRVCVRGRPHRLR